jgi:hypothetical protein
MTDPLSERTDMTEPAPTAEEVASAPPVWEVIRPAPGKARPYPARPTHWPRRRANRQARTRKDERS